ncbi:MAG: hypothetical protein AAGE80_02910 [Pseudomonadota bacterium]
MSAVLADDSPPGRRLPRQVVKPPGLRRVLAETYRDLRNDPADRDARLALAELLLHTDRRDLAPRHLRRLARNVKLGWGGAPRLGKLLFRIGDFESARRLLGACLERGLIDDDAMRTLSAITYRMGDRQAAKRHLAAAGWLRPINTPGRIEADRPTILRLRSFVGSRCGVKRNKETGLFSHWLKNGHFSVKHFFPDKDYNHLIANFAGENVGLVSDLPAFDLAINSVSCPDLMARPLGDIARFLERFPKTPVINPPEKVLETTRAKNYARLNPIPGIRFPQTLQVRNDAEPGEVRGRIEAAGIAYPMILRRVGTQTGKTMALIASATEAEAYIAALAPGVEIYAIRYLDCRGADGLHHKIRCFFIDGVFYPVACLSNDVWQIHSGDRYRVMSTNPATQEAERAYLSDPAAYLGERVFTALHEIAKIIDLDFFGIDFAPDGDGGAIVFEANAAMRHNYDHAETFPYTKPHLDRVSDAMGRMVADRAARSKP